MNLPSTDLAGTALLCTSKDSDISKIILIWRILANKNADRSHCAQVLGVLTENECKTASIAKQREVKYIKDMVYVSEYDWKGHVITPLKDFLDKNKEVDIFYTPILSEKWEATKGIILHHNGRYGFFQLAGMSLVTLWEIIGFRKNNIAKLWRICSEWLHNTQYGEEHFLDKLLDPDSDINKYLGEFSQDAIAPDHFKIGFEKDSRCKLIGHKAQGREDFDWYEK